jgi:hypothetical protein
MKKRRCHQCVYGIRPLACQACPKLTSCCASLLLCANHPDSPGVLTEVTPTHTCRNFRARPEPPNDEVRYIALTKGLCAIVDAEDYEEVSQYKWSAHINGANRYAVRCNKGKRLAMHRFIMKPPKGMVVDHIDGNGLNNRRSNLRICTAQQNQCNRKPRGRTSRFKGVRYRKEQGKYVAAIMSRGELIHIGCFDDEEEAAHARDRKAIELHGEFAYLNFPDRKHAEQDETSGRTRP